MIKFILIAKERNMRSILTLSEKSYEVLELYEGCV
jgi:hypothetical protein